MRRRVVLLFLAMLSVVAVFTACEGDKPAQIFPWVWGGNNDPSVQRTTTPGEVGIFAENGAYTWWTNMLAVRFVGNKDQTYLSYVDEEGNMSVAAYNHETGEYTYNTLAKHEVDDHNSAGLAILPDGRILAVYTRHNKDRIVRWRISKNPEDITSFGKEKTVEGSKGITYAQLHRISDTEYRLLYRYTVKSWATRIYNYETGKWSDEQVWLTEGLGHHYYLWTQEDRTEGKINIFMTGHPKSGPDQNIRYGYFDADGILYTTGGKRVGEMIEEFNITVPNPRHFDIVYEAKEGEHTRLYDVSYMGEKVAVMYGISLEEGDTSKYYYAYYDEKAGEWVNNFICDSGRWLVSDNMYFDGVSFDKKDMQTIYVSRREGDLLRLEKWTTTDYGATWTSVLLDEATNPEEHILRPLIPYNAHDDMDVLYMKGYYPSYVKFDTNIMYYAD